MTKAGRWSAGAIVALVGVAGGACFAQSAPDCFSVADDKARLKCYDDEAREKRKAAAPAISAAPTASAASLAASGPAASGPAASGPAASGPAASGPAASGPAASESTAFAAPAGTAASAPAEFGLDPEAVRKKREAANPQAPKEPDQVSLLVKSVMTKAHGEYRIVFEDGQVWEETQHSGDDAPKAGETVTIKRGLFGSYFLNRKGGLALRVQRVH